MAKDATTPFVRKLAHNDTATRNAAFKSLQAFLKSKSSKNLDLLEMEKLWKGLYFSMWFCDKPIPQQALAGNLGKLFSEDVPQDKLAIFHEAFWVILLKEWPSVDKWRLDKYLMLVRRVLRHNFFRLEANGWPQEQVDEFVTVLQKYPLSDNQKFPLSLAYHVCDIFIDEIEYVIFKDFRDFSQEDDIPEELDDDSDDEDSDAEKEEPTKQDQKELKKESEEEIASKKAAIVAKTPIAALIAPFESLAATAKNRALRSKIKDEVLADERLEEWEVVKNDDASDSEEEWTGF